jgi:hypothetical protein
MLSISSILEVVHECIEVSPDKEHISLPLIIQLLIALINNRNFVDQQGTKTHLLQVISSELDCFRYFRRYRQSSECLSD